MGLTASAYCGHEIGKRQLDVAELKQLARILNTIGNFLLEIGPIRDTRQTGQETCHEFMAFCGESSGRSKKTMDNLMALLPGLREKSGE